MNLHNAVTSVKTGEVGSRLSVSTNVAPYHCESPTIHPEYGCLADASAFLVPDWVWAVHSGFFRVSLDLGNTFRVHEPTPRSHSTFPI